MNRVARRRVIAITIGLALLWLYYHFYFHPLAGREGYNAILPGASQSGNEHTPDATSAVPSLAHAASAVASAPHFSGSETHTDASHAGQASSDRVDSDAGRVDVELPHSESSPDTHTHSDVNVPEPAAGQSTESSYWDGMEEILDIVHKMAKCDPGIAPLGVYNRDIGADWNLKHELPVTSTVMSLYLQLDPEDTAKLKQSHHDAMQLINAAKSSNAFSGRGIVMTGGGKYFPMVLTAVRWVRDIDPDIPIEVFMADNSEYEPKICKGLFKTLNVECRVIEDVYGEGILTSLGSKYALKPLALLASKFDDVYFMDADSLPMYKLDHIFDSDLYADKGMLLTRDYWARFVSPHYYEIAGIELGGRARGPDSDVLLQADRENAIPGMSSESGQIFVRKSTHLRTLLLSTYYNIFGSAAYFALLTQHGPGEGDKDTYAAAATVVGEPFYQTQRLPATLGTGREGGGFEGYAIVQPDPLTDYAIYEEGKDVEEKFFALHSNQLKANPKCMLKGYEMQERACPPLQKARYFGDIHNIKHETRASIDVERHMFEAMSQVACEWALDGGFVPLDWSDENLGRMCRILKQHVHWIDANPYTSGIPKAQFEIDEDTDAQ